MELRIIADSPEMARLEIVQYLEYRAEQIRRKINITDKISEKRSYETQANAIMEMVSELKDITILDLSQPQDFDTIEQMEDAARSRLDKAIHAKSDDPWFKLSVILYSDNDQGYFYDFGPNLTVTREEAQKRLAEINRKRDAPKPSR